jgi:siderophore synthetase component
MKELGEAVNSALSDSEQIARAVDRMKETGYEIVVKFEATLGVRKKSEWSSKESTLAFELDPNPTITDDQLQQLMKELREAIKSELDSEQLARAAAPIKEKGYQPFVTLEANIRIRKPTIH